MAKRKVLKITPVLVTLNILVLLIIVAFYTTRLIKYYLKENGHRGEDVVLLVEELKKHRSYLDETKGLVFDEEKNIYTYKGEVDDNYLLYSGIMYRILGIDENENMKAVSEENVTILYPGYDKGYEKSYVNKWLNSSEEKYSGIFENTLVNSGGLLEKTTMCYDVIDDPSNITCEEKNGDYKVALLSLYDYKEAGGKTSFLNNDTQYHLGTLNKDGLNYSVTEDGEVVINKSSTVTVKPVITINSGTELLRGSGTEDDPYIIEKHNIDTLGDTYVNSIVLINNTTYKVVEIQEDKVKVASTDVLLKDADNEYYTAFGGSNSAYSTSNTVGKYLNNTFLNSLDVKSSVVASNYYIGALSLANLDYAKTYESKVKAKVGMLTIGDMFVSDLTNVFTTLRGMQASNIITVINENGNLFADTINSKYNVRPAFYLKSDLKITSGDGTIDSPFELGENNEQE